MIFAPIGAFGGMAYTISKYGIDTLVPLAKLMATVYITMAIFIFGALWLILKYYRVSILKYLNYIKRRAPGCIREHRHLKPPFLQ